MPESATYTHGHPASVLRSHNWRTADNSAAYLLPHLREDMNLLDIGCGPGTVTLGLAERLPAGRVTGIDIAPEVVELARGAAQMAGATNVHLAVGDALCLDFPDKSFDVVHAHQVLQHLADPVAGLREMRRVCRPGGLVAARDGDFEKMTWYPEEAALRRWVEIYCSVARANGGEPDAARRLWAWARAAGLPEITPSASAWCFATDEDRHWWSEVWADRISNTQLADRAIELKLADREELKEIAQAWSHWASIPDACFLVLQGEILCRT